MRRSEAFLGTSREAPDAGTAVTALLQRAGMIRQFGSGLYGFLPAGERVREKITDRVRAGMADLGAQAVSLPALQYRPIWAASGRWGNFEDEMFTLANREGQAMCLAPSHEEGAVHLLDGLVRSHDDLPLLVYQVTEKYRDDHARNGLVRCKAFTMKDAYSVHATEASLRETYVRMREAYRDVFADLGLEVAIATADNSVMGGSNSEEFVAPVDDGTVDLLSCTAADCRFGATDEQDAFEDLAADGTCPDCGAALRQTEGIEVGHIFELGTRYSEAMGLTVDRADGTAVPAQMGSYGIGVTRVLQTLVQQHGTAEGCRWPVTDWGSVAPFRAGIVPLRYEGEHRAVADRLHEALGREDVVLFDDPGQSIGERFAESGLLGLPATVVVGNHYDETGEVEVEFRDGETVSVAPEAVPGVVDRFAAGG
ncbi:MAG: aminoacyl--tRNA ligase-related protein [Halanaeroarchaeum sp.]